jgi:hypothetical protein
MSANFICAVIGRTYSVFSYVLFISPTPISKLETKHHMQIIPSN